MSTLTTCRATYREHTYFGYRPPAPPRAAAPPSQSAPAANEWWRWPGELRAAHDTYTREAQEWAEQCGGNLQLSRAHRAAADCFVCDIER